jgi:hypothetical protein
MTVNNGVVRINAPMGEFAFRIDDVELVRLYKDLEDDNWQACINFKSGNHSMNVNGKADAAEAYAEIVSRWHEMNEKDF